MVFVTLASVALVTILQTLPPPPLPATAPPTAFSAERAIEHIKVIAREPHPAGSPANDEVRNYLLATLKSLGLEAQTQRVGDIENVMGKIMGTESADAVLLTAHFDSARGSPGASDDGSGVAALLETARALKAQAPLRNTVLFLFADGEENGHVGARAFIAHHPWAADARIVIGLDAGGVTGPGVLSATSARNGWLIRQLARADSFFAGSSAINALAQSGTDFGHAFKAAGFSGYAFDLYWDRRIHTPKDSIEHLHPPSIQHQGSHALSLARHFGNLTLLADPKEPDAVYFSILRRFFVAYPTTWAIPIAIAMGGVSGAVLVFGLRRRVLDWAGMGYSVFVLLVGLIVAPLPAVLLALAGPWGRWNMDTRWLDQPFQVTMIVLIAVALTVFSHSLLGRARRTSLPDLAMGALLPLFIGAIAMSAALPALSFLLVWPLLLCVLADANWFYWHVRQKNSALAIAGLLLSGSGSIVIMGPTIILGLFDQMPLTLVLLGALCGFLAPQIRIMVAGRSSIRNEEAGLAS